MTSNRDLLMRRFAAFYIVPVLLLWLAVLAPLMTGDATLFQRDVLTAHYPMKASQAAAWERGELPLVDPFRAGGQPMLGNPNGLPLYPDNLLYLVASPLWALNAHFWLHLLLAPFAFYWLGRAWGLGRPAAWAGGVFYGSSGFLLSLLNLYNLIAGAALAPAFAAAMLDAWTSESRRRWIVAAILWALLLLAGDPLFALLALVAALVAVVLRHRQAPRAMPAASVTLLAGSALALPMWVEFLRILPLSYRGYWPSSAESALTQSLDPRTAVEWLVPLFFGRPDLSFWGFDFYGGVPPLFYSLAPSLLVLALLPLSGRSVAARWSWILLAVGLFFALGRFNPIVAALFELPGASLLRYPVKFWLFVALATSMLAALGSERLERGAGRRRAGWALAVLGVLQAAAWGWISFSPADTLAALEEERLRLGGVCLLSIVLLLLLAGALYLTRRRPALGGGLLLVVHAAGQIFFLGPLFEHDEARFYLDPPQILEALLPDERVVHGDFKDLFGPNRLAGLPPSFPDTSGRWLARAHFAQLYPFAGAAWERRYEFNPSPEGLDSFFTVALVQAMARLDDAARLRLLAASGVDVLILGRELAPAARGAVRERTRRTTALGDVHVYEIVDAAPPVALATTVWREPGLGEALRRLVDPGFDPLTMVVLPGESPRQEPGPGGRARLVEDSTDAMEIEVEVDGEGGWLLVQRTHLEIYRATIDGERAEIEPANVHRMAVAVPPGAHRVRIWADRRPTRFTWAAAGLGLAALIGLSVGRARGKTRE